MPYVRQRGNQLAIVHGERDTETRKVEQRILFTIYSRAEACEALGKGGKNGAHRFESLMESRYPELRFNWKKIRAAIAEKLDVLPESYEYKAARLHSSFRADLSALLRQVALADPQLLFSAAQLIQGQREELAFLRDLIDWRLATCSQQPNEWNQDDQFYWRFALSGGEVPNEVEEFASSLYSKGQLDEAETRFKLLIECFDGYAEGYNYLGLIELDRGRLPEAISWFEKTIEVGRKKFPKRLAKRDYWTVLETRPYMRGLRNLCLALNRAGRYTRALEFCERLHHECGDDMVADVYRATIHLNSEDWAEALDLGDSLHQLYPTENFVAALAAFEAGDAEGAIWRFLHASLNSPRAAHMLLGMRTRALKQQSRVQVEDHNTGVTLLQNLHGFLAEQSPRSQRFFRKLLRHKHVVALLKEREAVVQRWSGPKEPEEEWRAAFDRMHAMGTPEFAREQAVPLLGLLAAR